MDKPESVVEFENWFIDEMIRICNEIQYRKDTEMYYERQKEEK